MRRRPPHLIPRIALLALTAFAGCVLFSGASVEARLEHAEWKAAAARFQEVFAEPGDPLAKSQVLAKIRSDDGPRAWLLMADGLQREVHLWTQVHREHQALSAEHGALLWDSVRGHTGGMYKKLQHIQSRLPGREKACRVEDEALAAVIRAVSVGPEALRTRILARRKLDEGWPYRAAAARVAANTYREKAAAAYFVKALTKDPDPRVRSAALEALAATDEDVQALVIGRLVDPDWRIQLQAARWIERRRVREAVPHLINALPAATLRVAHRVARVLRTITQQEFGVDAQAWATWWAKHGEEYGDGVEVDVGEPRKRATVHVFGIPLESDRVLFVLDISVSTRRRGRYLRPRRDRQERFEGSMLDLGRQEIVKAISAMPEAWQFNVCCYNHGAILWRRSMPAPGEANRESVVHWLGKQKSHGSSYVYGALRTAFRAAGAVGIEEPAPVPAVDTIVLVSDGMATDNSMPTAKLMNPKVIHDHVAMCNRGGPVVIHCICLDKGDYMRKLAKDNGGTYLDKLCTRFGPR